MKEDRKEIKEESFDTKRLINAYMKSNYRIIGPHKHSAIKPCHWQEQKLLTGRDNRNCYKGYFGIPSHLCVQNTPALPFCNHACVFCWRDIENASFGAKWRGAVDDPYKLANEMIRHSKNLIFEHISLQRSLDNLELMQGIMKEFRKQYIENNQQTQPKFNDIQLMKILNTTRNKIQRALLLLKATNVLNNPEGNLYAVKKELLNELKEEDGANNLIERLVTNKEDIIKVFEEAKTPRHAAISLAGEPTLYPRIGELVDAFRKKRMSTFIVTNGTNPEVIEKLWKNNQLPTQLYVTLTAPTKELYKKVSRPMEKDGWERIMQTLSLLPKLPCRTVIRITSIKHINIGLDLVPGYIKILKKYTPHFIDIKGFTIEANALNLIKRLKTDKDLRDFTTDYNSLYEFAKALEEQGGFEIIEEHEPSRDILLRGSWPRGKSIKIDYNGPL